MATSAPNSDMRRLLDYSVGVGNDVTWKRRTLPQKWFEKRHLVRSLCRNSSTRNGKLALFSLRPG